MMKVSVTVIKRATDEIDVSGGPCRGKTPLLLRDSPFISWENRQQDSTPLVVSRPDQYRKPQRFWNMKRRTRGSSFLTPRSIGEFFFTFLIRAYCVAGWRGSGSRV
jgi:hypothetical protein